MIVSDPPLASLREMQDGTYSIDDLFDMHEALDVIDYLVEQKRIQLEREART